MFDLLRLIDNPFFVMNLTFFPCFLCAQTVYIPNTSPHLEHILKQADTASFFSNIKGKSTKIIKFFSKYFALCS